MTNSICSVVYQLITLIKNDLNDSPTSYIKEFVHGDFGRTKPNLGVLMETEVDILELDVEVCFIEP